MDFPFWNAIVSNAVLATILAVLAVAIRRWLGHPRLEHFVWLLVLLKMFTPPLWSANIPWPAAEPVMIQTAAAAPISGEAFTGMAKQVEQANSISTTTILTTIWLCGSLLVLAVYVDRSRKFARVVKNASLADPSLRALVDETARQLHLRNTPRIKTVRAAISPLICWQGTRLTLLLPAMLIEQLSPAALQSILAHELAHLKRRDHLVRLLESLATICFWWHPVAWVAKRRLQECGELCCDAHVLSHTSARPKLYAQALLQTMDWLSGQRPCVTWSVTAATGNFDSMTRRFQMLQTNRQTSHGARWLSLGTMLLLTASMGLGVAVGQETAPPTMPPAADQQPDQALLTMEFRLTETDAAGQTEVLCSPRIMTPADAKASFKTEGGARQIEVLAQPIKASTPQQWKIGLKLKEQDKVICAPMLIVVDNGSVEIGNDKGEKLTFTVDIKPGAVKTDVKTDGKK